MKRFSASILLLYLLQFALNSLAGVDPTANGISTNIRSGGFVLQTVSMAQGVLVNEALSSNTGSFVDEDGEAVDWIELYNASASLVQLEGFGLSEDSLDAYRWTFPHLELSPDEYAVVFASGKDRKGLQGAWETVIARGTTWKYSPGSTSISSQWIENSFDDSGWSSGRAGIGYGDGDDATTTGTLLSLFARRAFTVADTSVLSGAVFHIDFDDAFIAYLNGVEIARSNIGTPGVRVPATQTPAEQHEARLYQGLSIDGYDIPANLFLPGENLLAVQVQNISTSSSDLTMIPFLTLGTDAVVPDRTGVDEEISDSFEREYHTNFKLASDETICLTSPDQTLRNCLPLQSVPANTSVGRLDDGTIGLFGTPTPGAENQSGASGIAGSVTFSQPSGVYPSSINVSLFSSGDGRVYYTTNGTEPTSLSTEYLGPLGITKTTIVSARMIGDGLLPGPTSTETFVVGTEHDLPVASLVTHPFLLFHPVTGMYELGPNAQSSFPYFGANFWEDREIAVHLNWIDKDGTAGVNHGVGMKIYGGWSRGHAQKSFSLFARSRYGADAFRHRFFVDRAYSEFESIVLRNSGNDWNRSMLRDGFMQALVRNTAIDLMAYQPTVVYINGRYWGIHNLREKINEHYVTAISGADPDAIDLLEFNTDAGGALAIHGTTDAWDAVMARIGERDISSAEAYADVSRMIDMDNFIDYQIAQIFFDNRDWPGNNSKTWRNRSDDGRFRWILYDTDFGWGIWNSGAWQDNTLLFAMEPFGPQWPNPPWSTKLFRSLLRNQLFRTAFLNRYRDFVNVHFDSDEIARVLAETSGAIESEMERHAARWEYSVSSWNQEIQRMQTFGERRPASMSSHVEAYFGVSSKSPVSVAVDGDVGGRVFVNRESFRTPWIGNYYHSVILPITAVPDPGFRFSHWSGSSTATDRVLSVDPANAVSLTAHFVSDPGDPSAVVINEIQYNPSGTSGEWMELTNVGETAIDMSGWMISDSADSTSLVSGVIQPGAFVVLCEDPSAFGNTFGFPCFGNLPFRMGNGGDVLKLTDASGVLVDSVSYSDGPPWPSDADGSGRSLELVDARSDNSLASAWRPSVSAVGSPGRANATTVSTDDFDFESSFEVSVYPNPFREHASVSLILPRPGEVLIEVFDVLGRRIAHREAGILSAGQHQLSGVISSARSGLMIVRVSVDGVPVGSTTGIGI